MLHNNAHQQPMIISWLSFQASILFIYYPFINCPNTAIEVNLSVDTLGLPLDLCLPKIQIFDVGLSGCFSTNTFAVLHSQMSVSAYKLKIYTLSNSIPILKHAKIILWKTLKGKERHLLLSPESLNNFCDIWKTAEHTHKLFSRYR